MLSRDQALALLHEHVPDISLCNHSRMTEAVMRALARRLGRDEELWGVSGLLHDLDFVATKDDAPRHGLIAAGMLEGKLPDEAVTAIRAHNGDMNGHPPATEFDFALRCGETVTGLVAANALVRPERMAGMAPKSLKKRMKEKAFARNVNRETILECERIGLEPGEFFQIAIDAIAPIASEVGLA